MTKLDIINKVSKGTGLSKIETEAVFNGIILSIESALVSGDRVDIRGFGNFILKKRNARIARNPMTQEKVSLPERFIPSFKVSKSLINNVNNSLKNNR